MGKKKKPEPLADGSIPRMGSGITYRVSASTLDTNWLLNAVLGTKALQITKISDDQVFNFLHILDSGNLLMPDGTLGLQWVKDRLKKRLNEAEGQRGEIWYKVVERYEFILSQIDLLLVSRDTQNDREEKDE